MKIFSVRMEKDFNSSGREYTKPENKCSAGSHVYTATNKKVFEVLNSNGKAGITAIFDIR